MSAATPSCRRGRQGQDATDDDWGQGCVRVQPNLDGGCKLSWVWINCGAAGITGGSYLTSCCGYADTVPKHGFRYKTFNSKGSLSSGKPIVGVHCLYKSLRGRSAGCTPVSMAGHAAAEDGKRTARKRKETGTVKKTANEKEERARRDAQDGMRSMKLLRNVEDATSARL